MAEQNVAEQSDSDPSFDLIEEDPIQIVIPGTMTGVFHILHKSGLFNQDVWKTFVGKYALFFFNTFYIYNFFRK